MPDFLQTMADSSRARAASAEQKLSASTLQALIADAKPPARFSKDDSRIGIIAECKRAAPSAGVLAESVDVAARVAAYAKAGASAVSVLTEPDRFSGSIEDLETATGATSAPVMRKDFLTTPYQVLEARAAGASGVLLIAAILTPDELLDMQDIARQHGMFALVECFDEADIEKTQDSGASLIGINCRNLRTLGVEFSRFEKLKPYLGGVQSVAESGITYPQDLATVNELGYDFALIGSALMTQADPEAALRALRRQGVKGA
ncbi:MAG: indole-3-glycerol phosphate synthase TrpC [Planctomycetota bacterium]|jgi:indole-3-glycerol phosphate synthase